MDKSLIGVFIGSLITLVGIWLNSIFTRKNLKLQLKHQQQADAYKLKLEQLAELYKMISVFIAQTAAYSSDLLYFKNAKFTVQDYHQLTKQLIVSLGDISSLVRINVPEVEKEFNDLLKLITRAMESGSGYLQSKNDFNELKAATSALRDASTKMLSVIKNLAEEHKIKKEMTEIIEYDFY